MLRLNPAFNEHNYDFDSFKSFLVAQNDIVHLRTASEGGHLEVQIIAEDESTVTASSEGPAALLDRYLKYLSQQKIRMTPTEHRPRIILKFYNIFKNNPESSLTALKEELHAFFEETAPNVKWQYVHETIHQLFRTYCLQFDQDDSKYSSDVRLWDRQVSLVDGVNSPAQLLRQCDRGLMQKIARKVGSVDQIDREVAARLLYGSVRGDKMLEHVNQMVDELNSNGNR